MTASWTAFHSPTFVDDPWSVFRIRKNVPGPVFDAAVAVVTLTAAAVITIDAAAPAAVTAGSGSISNTEAADTFEVQV
jgi:hypothetical protein